jgi:membrane-associated phospholipid phosphatase
VHYLTDVLAGAIIGATAALAATPILDWRVRDARRRTA